MKLSKRNQSRGFSIIELIAAVVIFGILAGIGIGHYQRNWTEERLKAITRETSAWLEDARLQALQQSETCVIEIDDANAALKAASHEDGNHCVEIASLDLKGKVQNIEDLVLCSEASTWCSSTAAAGLIWPERWCGSEWGGQRAFANPCPAKQHQRPACN